MIRKSKTRNLRSAVTLTEAVVATVLLGLAVAGVGHFVSSVQRGLKDRELSARLDWEMVNARETIGSWPVEWVTQERIESLSVSPTLLKELTDVHWEAEVSSILDPVAATQVTLTLACNYGGQKARPQQLTFWMRERQPEVADAVPSGTTGASDDGGGGDD